MQITCIEHQFSFFIYENEDYILHKEILVVLSHFYYCYVCNIWSKGNYFFKITSIYFQCGKPVWLQVFLTACFCVHFIINHPVKSVNVWLRLQCFKEHEISIGVRKKQSIHAYQGMRSAILPVYESVKSFFFFLLTKTV